MRRDVLRGELSWRRDTGLHCIRPRRSKSRLPAGRWGMSELEDQRITAAATDGAATQTDMPRVLDLGNRPDSRREWWGHLRRRRTYC